MNRKTFEEVIAFAIEKEEEAASFYDIVSGLAQRPNVKAMFEEMKEEELKHKDMLEKVRAPEKLSGYEIEAVPDLKIGDYLVDVDFDPEMDYQEALILAIKREEKSLALYTHMAHTGEDEELQRLFKILSEQEAKHKLKLETEYDETVLIED